MRATPVSTTARLEDYLSQKAADGYVDAAVPAVIVALAGAARSIALVLASGPLAGALGAETGRGNQGGDAQKTLDVMSDEIVLKALREVPVGWYISEEQDQPTRVNPKERLVVAVDPLDGSSNIDTNVSVGTIFSILLNPKAQDVPSLLRPGTAQITAGYFIYGPQTSLVVTLGDGVDLFVLDRGSGSFHLAESGLRVPKSSTEFAINASNYRHWQRPVRAFIDDCLAGTTGPIGRDHNMRWIASMIADAHRIFRRGGIYLYPGDLRSGYAEGRLRLIYEASPIAMLMEQAGGMATDGTNRILDKVPASLHERTPLVFGSSEEVKRVAGYYTRSNEEGQAWPLFGTRGLFRS